jgi:hypothetical protein
LDLAGEVLKFEGAQAMFQYKDRLVADSRPALSPKLFEVTLEPSAPFREVHAPHQFESLG